MRTIMTPDDRVGCDSVSEVGLSGISSYKLKQLKKN